MDNIITRKCDNLEIKHAFSCLLKNNPRGADILFEIQTPRRYPRLLCFINISKPMMLFSNNHENTYFISILPRLEVLSRGQPVT